MITKSITVEVSLEIALFQEDEIWVAYCPDLEISGYGDTEKEAKDSFDTMLDIFLKETHKKGTLEKCLLQLGWDLRQKPTPVYNRPAHSMKEQRELLSKNPNVYNDMVALPVC